MKNSRIEPVPGGTVTSPKGFTAGGVCAHIKNSNSQKLDLGILYSEAPCETAGMFTKARIKSGPVILDQAGEIDRKALAAIVFGDPALLRQLESIVHPAVLIESARRRQSQKRGGGWVKCWAGISRTKRCFWPSAISAGMSMPALGARRNTHCCEK